MLLGSFNEHSLLTQSYTLSEPTIARTIIPRFPVSHNSFQTRRSRCRVGVIIEFLPHNCGLLMDLHPCHSCKVIRIPAALTVEKNITIVNVVRKHHALPPTYTPVCT